MKRYLIPAVGIVLVTVGLVAINEFTELTIVEDYALILIVAAMLLGVWLSKISGK
ncbi:MAG: hypothetical protein V2I24_06595 [Halieaceae bacterium]|jgi:hypothetical protein|nr:hypothetical protein [Halieaceae bacterium]